MKMIDLPSAWRLFDDREQLARLLRREHGGRLVEDQDVGAAVERLQDLDALLLADRDLRDERGRVDREAELAARSRATRCSAPRSSRRKPSLRRLHAEHDVLGDGHHRDQHEVLVHHPDPRVDRVLRRAERDGLAVQRGSRPSRACRARRGCSSASTCRRRSRRAARAPRRGASSKSTWSFATMPGNAFVIPRISRTRRRRRLGRCRAHRGRDPNAGGRDDEGRALRPAPRQIADLRVA